MPTDDFEPLPVPPCSAQLVATLKQRLHEAIVAGKASDAKTFLDVIERLARLNWLDDLDPAQRYAATAYERAREDRALHEELYAFAVNAQQNENL